MIAGYRGVYVRLPSEVQDAVAHKFHGDNLGYRIVQTLHIWWISGFKSDAALLGRNRSDHAWFDVAIGQQTLQGMCIIRIAETRPFSTAVVMFKLKKRQA